MKALFGETRQYSAALSHDLFGVKDGSSVWYGGSQNLYQTQREKTCGCGIAGAADIVLYIDAINRIKAEGHRKACNETKVTDSGIQIDIRADYIGGEVRLAIYHDGETATPISGFSFSGSFKQALNTLTTSKETVKISRYNGPKYIRFKNVSVM